MQSYPRNRSPQNMGDEVEKELNINLRSIYCSMQLKMICNAVDNNMLQFWSVFLNPWLPIEAIGKVAKPRLPSGPME